MNGCVAAQSSKCATNCVCTYAGMSRALFVRYFLMVLSGDSSSWMFMSVAVCCTICQPTDMNHSYKVWPPQLHRACASQALLFPGSPRLIHIHGCGKIEQHRAVPQRGVLQGIFQDYPKALRQSNAASVISFMRTPGPFQQYSVRICLCAIWS